MIFCGLAHSIFCAFAIRSTFLETTTNSLPNAQIFRNHMFFHVCIVHGPCKAIWADLDSTTVVLAENDHFLCFGLSRSNYHPQSERKFPQTAATRKKNSLD